MFGRNRQRITGLDLKLARVGRGVPQRAIARHLGVSPQRISAVEATYWPTARSIDLYLAALTAIAGTSRSLSLARTEREPR